MTAATDYVAVPVSAATIALCDQASKWHGEAPPENEGRRVVAYCVGELLSGRRNQSDVDMFRERIAQVLRGR